MSGASSVPQCERAGVERHCHRCPGGCADHRCVRSLVGCAGRPGEHLVLVDDWGCPGVERDSEKPADPTTSAAFRTIPAADAISVRAARTCTTMSRLSWKRGLGRLASQLPHSADRRVILLYHAIGNSPWAVREVDFRSQMRWLECAEICSLDELLHDDTARGLRVALTFDDGYASLLDVAAELLDNSGATATVYLNSGLIDENSRRRSVPEHGHYPDEEFLSWSDVAQLAALNWTIAAHGVQHLDLTAAAPDLAADELNGAKTMMRATHRRCM